MPLAVRAHLQARVDFYSRHLVEVVADAGELVELVLRDGTRELTDLVVDADQFVVMVADWEEDGVFVGADHRAAFAGCLHRFSVKYGRSGQPVGLTARVGKHCPGSAAVLEDVIARVAKGESLLLLGVSRIDRAS